MLYPFLFFIALHVVLFYSNPKRESSHEYASRWVSFVHSLIVTYLSIYYIRFDDRLDWLGGENKPEYTFILSITGAYTIYDVFYFVLLADKMDYEFIYHHVLVFFTCFASIITNQSGGCLVMNNAISECTTPFMNIRFFLRYYSMERTLLFLFNDMVFSFSFLYCRLYLAHRLAMETLYSGTVLLPIRLLVIPFYILNMYWSYGITKLIIRRIRSFF